MVQKVRDQSLETGSRAQREGATDYDREREARKARSVVCRAWESASEGKSPKRNEDKLTSKQVGSARRGNTSKKTIPSLGKPVRRARSRSNADKPSATAGTFFLFFFRLRSSPDSRGTRLGVIGGGMGGDRTGVDTEFRLEVRDVRHDRQVGFDREELKQSTVSVWMPLRQPHRSLSRIASSLQ